jgi:hypothetical protein
VNAFGDKAKLRTSRHPKRRPRVMRQHEDGRVIYLSAWSVERPTMGHHNTPPSC